jgi:hypothetical protein
MYMRDLNDLTRYGTQHNTTQHYTTLHYNTIHYTTIHYAHQNDTLPHTQLL